MVHHGGRWYDIAGTAPAGIPTLDCAFRVSTKPEQPAAHGRETGMQSNSGRERSTALPAWQEKLDILLGRPDYAIKANEVGRQLRQEKWRGPWPWPT